jgi:hypothetical protein
VAVLAPAYLPRRPTDTVLQSLVGEHLESFLAHTREHYEGGLPRYVEDELRAYLKCGLFLEGFVRAHCDTCGHDLLIAFSCKSRTTCPSCAGRRMANTAAAVVDRVLPDVPVRQYVLSLPFDVRRLAAFKADMTTALERIFVETIFASYRAAAKRAGLKDAQCGAVSFVQRFGSSLNLNVRYHVVVLGHLPRAQDVHVTRPGVTAGVLGDPRGDHRRPQNSNRPQVEPDEQRAEGHKIGGQPCAHRAHVEYGTELVDVDSTRTRKRFRRASSGWAREVLHGALPALPACTPS